MTKLKAAIIGCGPCNASRGGVNSISYAHARALVPLAGVELVAAASRNPQNVADFCAEFAGVKGYTDYLEMLATEKPQWVSVCAFPPDREAMALAALENGAQVLVLEKPFTVSIGAARRIMAAAAAKNARVFVDHQRRYGRVFEWFKEQTSGPYGAVKQVNVQHPGKGFINFGPHLVDAGLLALEGRTPVAIQAAVDWSETNDYQGVKTEANFVATTWFDDKSRLYVESGNQFTQPCIQAVCEKGLVEIYLSPYDATGSICRAVGGDKPQQSPLFDGEHFHHNDKDFNLFYDRAFPAMLDAYLTGKPNRLDAQYAFTGLQVIVGLYESARQGKRIALPLPDEAAIS